MQDVAVIIKNDKEALAGAVQKALSESHLSVRALSHETGISKTHINDIANGLHKAKLETLMVLADYFQIKYLFTNR